MSEPHKRYLLFRYNSEYPIGGIGDVSDSFDSKSDAIETCKESSIYNAAYVYDRIAGIVVYDKDDNLNLDK